MSNLQDILFQGGFFFIGGIFKYQYLHQESLPFPHRHIRVSMRRQKQDAVLHKAYSENNAPLEFH